MVKVLINAIKRANNFIGVPISLVLNSFCVAWHTLRF